MSVSVAEGQVRETALAWLAEGRRVALATVVRTWNSSPRPAGCLMIVDGEGRFAGSVSGGCVEAAVIEAALTFLDDGRPRTLEFGVTDEMAWEVGLPCGGRMEVFVGPVDREILEHLGRARRTRTMLALLTDLSNGTQRLLDPTELPDDLPVAQREFLERHATRDVCAVLEDGRRQTFVQVLGPPVHVIIVGAVHVAQVLCTLVRLAGFTVTVVDPREAFATPGRFPEVELVTSWPDEALRSLGLDRHTAVVTLAHDPKIDEPALAAALESDCFYVGALGGRKTQASRRERLREAGFDEEALNRIHGPVGLDIGAKTAAEIAISIIGQIIQRRRGG